MRCLVVGLFGYVIGGYTNTLEYRLRVGERPITKGCYCPHCRNELPQRDQIPIFSYLLLRGHCRFCGAPIGVHYPLVEAAVTLYYILLFALTAPCILLPTFLGMVGVWMYVFAAVLFHRCFHLSRRYLEGTLLMLFYHILILTGVGIVHIAYLPL